MSTITSSRLATGGIKIAKPGQIFFSPVGYGGNTSSTWVVPQGVYKISGVLITGGYGGNASPDASTGGAGGRGGHLLWFNDLSVSPGETLSILVSTFGAGGTITNRTGGNPGDTYVRRPNLSGITLFANAVASLSGTYREYAKIESAAAQTTASIYGAGGGGAAGYLGTGGSGIYVANGGKGGTSSLAAQAGTFGGGGGGKGGAGSTYPKGAGGGGTGFRGESTSGAGGTGDSDSTRGGGGGSGGSPGTGTLVTGDGGWPGGGGGGGSTTYQTGGAGNYGVVRIMWGSGRSYPSTNTADV